MNKIRSVFLIDDDQDDRDLFQKVLSEIDADIEFKFAVDGEDALVKLQEPGTARPDVIFVDMNMPKLSGDKFIVELKKFRPFIDIPIIVYSTAEVPVKSRESMLALGITNFVVKAESAESLKAQVYGMLIQFGICKRRVQGS